MKTEFLFKIRKFFNTATLRQSAIVFNGSVINGVLGAFFYISLARFLGPFDFGFFVVTVSVLTLIADIADFGTNTGLVRFVSAYLPTDREKAMRFLKMSLEIKFIVWMIVLFIGLLLSPIIAKEIFNKEDLTNPLRLSMIGVGGAMLFSFATSSFQAFQKFFTWSAVNIFSNFLRLCLIFLLFSWQQLSLATSLITYIALPFLGFFLALLLLPTRSFLIASGEVKEVKQLFAYNRWVALSTIFTAVSSRLDTFLSARLLSGTELGIYGAANQLVAIVPQLVGALGVVAAPKFASFTELQQMLTYFKKLQIMVIILAAVGLLVVPISYFIIPLFFGEQYSEAIVPFIILFMAMLIFLLAVPVHASIYYYFSKPQFFVALSVINLLVIGVGGFFLISYYGIIGAALTVFIGMIINLLISLKWFLSAVKDR